MRIGFAGLGAMGGPMAGHLLDAGHKLVVMTRSRESAGAALARGAIWAETPKALAAGSDLVFTALPGPAEIEAVMAGPIVAVYTAEDAKSIYEVRAALEEMAGRCFVERATEKECKALETAFAEMKRSYTSNLGADHLTVKGKFYAALTAGAHNPVLVEMLRLIHGRVSMLRATTLAQPGRLATSLAELGNIVQTIKARDAEAAARACRLHVENAGAIAATILAEDTARQSEAKPLPAKRRRLI